MAEYPDVEVFLAGGVVRDSARGSNRQPKDFDFFLRGRHAPDFVEGLSHLGQLSYGPFGSPRWSPGGSEPYADVMLIERFQNGVEKCTDIVGVLKQFDFTANAVAVDLRKATFYDPCNGVEDSRLGQMRAVRFDYPDEPITAGHRLTRTVVLWMRLMHYASVLELRPDEKTRRWLSARRHYVRERHRFAAVFFDPLLKMQTLACA